MKLDEEDESWLSLATTPGDYRGRFIDKAACVIASRCRITAGWEVRHDILRSAMARCDDEAVRKFAYDWGYRRDDPVITADVTKHIPGEHYHVKELGKKFDKYGDAIQAIEDAGMRFGTFRKVDTRPLLSGD